MVKSKPLLGHIAAILCVCMWGFNFVSASVILRVLTPFELLFFRIVLGTLVLYIVYPKSTGKTTLRQELLFAGAGFTGVTLYFLAENFALLNTTASNVGVIVAISPVFTGLLAWQVLDRAQPRARFFLGFLLAICGIGIISFAGTRLEINLAGDLLAILAALAWAVYCVFMVKINGFGIHIIQTTRRIFVYGLLFLLPAIIFMEFELGLERFAAPLNLFHIVFLGVGVSAGGFLLWNYSLEHLGAVKTTVYIYLVPPVTMVASVLFLDETVTWVTILGLGLAIMGLVLSNWKPQTGGFT